MTHIEYQVHIEQGDDPDAEHFDVWNLEELREHYPKFAALVDDAGEFFHLVFTAELTRWTVEPIEADDGDDDPDAINTELGGGLLPGNSDYPHEPVRRATVIPPTEEAIERSQGLMPSG